MSLGFDNCLFTIFCRHEVLETTPIDETIEGFAADFQLGIQVIESDDSCVVTMIKCVIYSICVKIFAVKDCILKDILTLYKFHFCFEHKAEFSDLFVKSLPLCVGLEGLHEIVFLIVLGVGLFVHVVELEGALYC